MSGIMINGVNSADVFDACYDKADYGTPQKKMIRETVPYMDGSWDFSALYGGIAYGDRTVTYTFDFIADTPPSLTRQVLGFVAWIERAYKSDIYDDEIIDWHFNGTCQQTGVKYDDTGMAATVTVKLLCHPYRIANAPTRIQIHAGENTVHNGGRPVLVKVDADSAVTLTIGGESQTVQGNTVTELLVPSGTSIITSTGACVVEWTEEVI